jgi:hypothetical protein
MSGSEEEVNVRGFLIEVGEERVHVVGEMDDSGTQWCPRCDSPVGVDLSKVTSTPRGRFSANASLTGTRP